MSGFQTGTRFTYASTDFEVLRRITRGKWQGYLLCQTWLGGEKHALAYFREDA